MGIFNRKQKAFTPSNPAMQQSVDSYTNYVSIYDSMFASQGYIYQSQPEVRTVVDFIARNVAGISLKLYDRISDNERREMYAHPLIQLIRKPNSATTRYRMIYGTVADLCIYDSAFWIKVISTAGKYALVRVPPEYMTVRGKVTPSQYILRLPNSGDQFFRPDEVVHFRGYSPTQFNVGTSPIETLKSVISEGIAAQRHRTGLWKRGARMEGLILRPSTAPDWSVEAKNAFLKEWEAATSGVANSGRTGMLEEDMTWVPTSFNPKATEYLSGMKLSAETVARAYHIPLPMVGLTDSANFASISEYHKMLYQEALPPYLTWIKEDIELQLFSDFAGLDSAYLEWNVSEKLKGSFEEQAQILSTSTGGPWVSVNEARARVDLPPIGDPDDPENPMNQILSPLNSVRGGGPQPAPTQPLEDGSDAQPMKSWTSNPTATWTSVESSTPPQKSLPPIPEELRDNLIEAHEKALARFFTRQRDVVLSRAGAVKSLATVPQLNGHTKADINIFDEERWNKELWTELYLLGSQTSSSAGQKAAAAFGSSYDDSLVGEYLAKNTQIASEYINAKTLDSIRKADGLDGIKQVFAQALEVRAMNIAASRVTQMTAFGTHAAAEQAGKGTKTWVVTNPRSRHPEMNGQTVAVDEVFSNGLRWPGDASGQVEDIANCRCLISFGD